MPLIKTTTTGAGANADVEAARAEVEAEANAIAAAQQQQPTTNATSRNATKAKGAKQKSTAANTAKRTTSNKMRATNTTTTTTHAKSVPATPVQPKSPVAGRQQYFISSSPEYERVTTAAERDGSDFMPHTYPNFNFDLSESSNEFDNDDLELDDSSLAMITPPPPYVDTPLQYAPRMGAEQQHTRRAATAPPPPTRKKLFQNREIFNIHTAPSTGSMALTPLTPSSSSFASAITPTKLSAAAAAMFAAPPQMAQKWKQLHRKRRRRNSSSGDSKELDKLVLQSVDWDDNDIY